MTIDPMQRFVGVKGDSPPWVLLNLPQAQSSIEQIDAALRKRLSQVEAHQGGYSRLEIAQLGDSQRVPLR